MHKLVSFYASYHAEKGCEERPTEFDPHIHRSANHVFDILAPVVNPIEPRDGHAFAKRKTEQHHATGGIIVKDLEYVNSTLRSVIIARVSLVKYAFHLLEIPSGEPIEN